MSRRAASHVGPQEWDAQSFTEAVAERMPSPLTLDYMRLNIDAR